MVSCIHAVFLAACALQFTLVSGTCSRLLARRVRKFLHSDVFSRLSISPEDLPVQCLLNPINDIYHDQEEHKTNYGSRDIKCGYCGKHFKSDMYLDRHFDNKHQDTIQPNRTTCLADLCPLFGCSEHNTHYHGERSGSGGGSAFSKLRPCSDDEVERHVYKCEVMSRRCFSHLNEASSTGESKMMTLFNNNVCKRLHCEAGVLVGHLVDQEGGEEDGEEAAMFFNVMRWIIALLVFVAIMLYVCTAGTLLRLFGRSRKSDLDREAGQRGGLLGSLRRSLSSTSKQD